MDPLVRGTDPRIRTKMSQIPNTDQRSRRSPPHSPYERRSSQQRLADRLRPALDRLRPVSPGFISYDDRQHARRRSRSRSPARYEYAGHSSRTRSHRRSRSAERGVLLDERSRSGHRRRHSRDRAEDLPRERRHPHREGYRRRQEERRPIGGQERVENSDWSGPSTSRSVSPHVLETVVKMEHSDDEVVILS